MASQWPPSPRVEDEESALKNEVTYGSGEKSKTEFEEARCRGSVDQCPIILDSNHEIESKRDYTSSTDNDGESIKGQSSDDSYGPLTPPDSKAGRKHSQYPAAPPNSRSWPDKVAPSLTTAKEPKKEVTSRGRPDMPRIQTDLDGDLQGMISGRRRAPSPYSYTKPEMPAKSDTSKRFSGNTFLSPEHIAPSQSIPIIGSHKRHSSARPRSKPRLQNDSDESSDGEKRQRHRSRHRPARETFSQPLSSAEDVSGAERRPFYHGYARTTTDRSSNKGYSADVLHHTDSNDQRGMRFHKESPHTSSAEDSRSKTRPGYFSRADKRLSTESSHASSPEEDRTRREDSWRMKEPEVQKSKHGSSSRRERPRLDLSGHQHSYHGAPNEERHSSGRHIKHGNHVLEGRHYLEPSALRSPKAMEEYLDKAFNDKKGRPYKESPHPSPCTSSRGSPPQSPPRTPRVDRRSRDYFSLGMPDMLSPSEAVRPRAPSRSESQYNQIKPLASVLGGGGARAMPSLSRSSTSSAEIHSSGISSKPAAGRRSRNASPVRDERGPFSRPGQDHAKGFPKIVRDEERLDSQPVFISGSTSHTSPAMGSFNRSNTRSGSFAQLQVEVPRLNHRAFSYSAPEDALHLRQPSSARPAQLHFSQPITPNSAPLPAMPQLPRSPSSSEKTPRQYQSSELAPCPRSVAQAGYYDWYTVVGMSQLDICPSCMVVLGASRFRDMFIPSTSKVPGQRILCDFSRPWVRHAWTQIIKQRRSSLEMIYQIIRNSETTKRCPGKGSDVRAWYRLPDPQTGNNIPNFDACSECVRSVEIIFPQLRGIFKRSGALVQEKTCDLNTQSGRHDSYLSLLDAAALQYDVERLREPNIQAFADFARKTARVRECTRDDMVMVQVWHFIPSLPEFTICEECFDQVVWPVADQPIASRVNRTLQLVPGAYHKSGISCQLYSERMRKIFLEAVKFADFEYLKQVALRRYGVERRLQEKHKILMNDMAAGKDRTGELQANIEEWRKWE